MDNSTATPPIFLWIGKNWYWLTPMTLLISGLIWTWIKIMILNRIKTIGSQLNKINKIIPTEALNKGYMLATQVDCASLRANCNNHVISGELLETMVIVKQAMALVINHNTEIPKEEKDKILRELVK